MVYYYAGGDFTVGLYSQRSPYNPAAKKEVDPNLGRHDDFLLLGPYIFAQRNDSGRIHLYISYLRQPFNLTKIPTTDPHDVRGNHFHWLYLSTKSLSLSLSLTHTHTQGYFVAHINELQALVIVQHISGRYNLYLSDITGVYFSLSLADIVVSQQRAVDLELVSDTCTLVHV